MAAIAVIDGGQPLVRGRKVVGAIGVSSMLATQGIEVAEASDAVLC